MKMLKLPRIISNFSILLFCLFVRDNATHSLSIVDGQGGYKKRKFQLNNNKITAESSYFDIMEERRSGNYAINHKQNISNLIKNFMLLIKFYSTNPEFDFIFFSKYL